MCQLSKKRLSSCFPPVRETSSQNKAGCWEGRGSSRSPQEVRFLHRELLVL